MRTISETPERWVIIRTPETYKVFGSWAGGYLDGDSWKLNSGIANIEEDSDHYYFYGHSGSCYRCHKKGYGIATSYSIGVLESLKNLAKKNGTDLQIFKTMDEWLDEGFTN